MIFFKGRLAIFLGAAMCLAAPAFGSGISFTCDGSIAADFQAGVCGYLNTIVAGLYDGTFANANASV